MRPLPAETTVELTLVVALACANVGAEVYGSGKGWVVAAGIVFWGGYLLWRSLRERRFLPQLLWGSRLQPQGLSALAAFTLAGVLLSLAAGLARGTWPPPPSFWLILLVYPLWGTAQQFLLNAVLARHLRCFLPSGWAHFLAALGFAAAHVPDWPVVAATFPAALVWVWVYPRVPQLPLLGAAHGVVGTFFFYLVLGRDVGQALGGGSLT